MSDQRIVRHIAAIREHRSDTRELIAADITYDAFGNRTKGATNGGTAVEYTTNLMNNEM